MHGARRIAGVVDVRRVDANQNRARLHEVLRRVLGQERVAFEVAVRAPVGVPAGAHENRLAANVAAGECLATDAPALREIGVDDQPFHVGQPIQGKLAQILAVGIAVKGRIEVGAGVGDHVDPADVELRARRIDGARLRAAQVIADERRR